MAGIFLTASNYPNFGHVHWNSAGAEGRPDSQLIQSTRDHWLNYLTIYCNKDMML